MGGKNWRSMLLTGILINFLIGEGSAIYFTQSQVTLSRSFIPESGLLYVVKAIAEGNEDGRIQYSISKIQSNTQNDGAANNGTTGRLASVKTAKCLDLVIDRNLGNISVPLHKEDSNSILPLGEAGLTCFYKVFAKLAGKSMHPRITSDRVEMTFSLQVTSPLSIISKDGCENISKKELCFGGIDQFELKIMENAPLTPVAYLGSLLGNCETLQVSYDVSVVEDVVSVTKATHHEPFSDVLTTKAGLDREAVDNYNMSISCIVRSSVAPNNYEVIQVVGKLEVLDENDNVLFTENGTSHVTIHISFSDLDFKILPEKRLTTHDHNDLLSRDNDTMSVNNHEIHSLNDTKQLLDFNLMKYRLDTPGLVNSTVVITQIRLSKHVNGIAPWDGDYCVAAVINDSTVIAPKRSEDLKYTICVSWGKKGPSPQPDERLPLDDLQSLVNSQVKEAHVPRSAQKYAPVLYAFPSIIRDFSEAIPRLEFSIIHAVATVEDDEWESNKNTEGGVITSTAEEYMNVFDITPKMGIIHLIHPELIRNLSLQSFQLQVLCNSSLIPSFVTNITIILESPVSNETLCDDELCSVHADSKSCELSCGYGSQGKCMWQQETGFNNSLSNDDLLDQPTTSRYPTCSPHLQTCPDEMCDEMEQLYPHICPQDCATELHGFGRLLKRNNGKEYGVDGKYCNGKGVVECQDAKTCSCNYITGDIMEITLQHTSRTSIVNNQAISTKATTGCDTQCMLIQSAIVVLAAAFILLIAYIVKDRLLRKRKSRALNQSVMMTAAGIDMSHGYGDNTRNGTLITDMEYGAGLGDGLFGSNELVGMDPKWEIPRDRLIVEHVLGEGQYGRVWKGKFYPPRGNFIHVAVKTIKEDPGEGGKNVLQEFMAEYSLLKQVDHPNVIKLLGACTTATTEDPLYLVMEFAELGALRNFLRRCRNVESRTNHVTQPWETTFIPGKPLTSFDLNFIVTPREVLSFCWQIAKGMAYLSDMKMVHRDLAARNILLTRLKVCKISDFGLTRDIYVDDAYQKKSKDRVPVKWLAPECLGDELYTTKSDVWGFGVLMWELATLGASPYPGVASEKMYTLLNTGYRMSKPPNCSNELYGLMQRCWEHHPSVRPTFHQLVAELSRMLEDGIEYLKLDLPTISNPGYGCFPQEDTAGSEVVNVSPIHESSVDGVPMMEQRTSRSPEGRPLSRRKLSMENLRLIDYEISTDGGFLNNKRDSNQQAPTHSCPRHTYINEPKIGEQDCSGPVPASSSSGYESPIKLQKPASVAV